MQHPQIWNRLKNRPHAVERYSVLMSALADLGAREEPAGSNHGPQIEHLVRGIGDYWWSGLTNPDYCAAAVSQWIRRGLGLPDWDRRRRKPFAPEVAGHPFGRWLVGCGQFADWAREHGATLEVPTPGAVWIIGYMKDGRQVWQHTGFVADYEPGAASFRTIEGNWNGGVISREMPVSQPVMFFRWWPDV